MSRVDMPTSTSWTLNQLCLAVCMVHRHACVTLANQQQQPFYVHYTHQPIDTSSEEQDLLEQSFTVAW